MSTELVVKEQNDLPIALRQKTFPFRKRTYGLALLISVILCSALPVLALALCIVLAFIGYIIEIISAIIAIPFFIGFLYYCMNNDAPEDLSGFLGLLFIDALLSMFVSGITYAIAKEIQEFAVEIPTNIFQFFLDYKIYIWAWIPVFIILLPTLFKICGIIIYFIYRVLSIVIYFLLKNVYRTIRTILLWNVITIDWLLSGRGFRYICPTEDCDFIGKTTDYQCPHCGKILTYLSPSNEGFFYKHCPHCNNRVSTFYLTGRNNYTKVCPKCHNTRGCSSFGQKPSTVFVVEGSSKSGKTSLLMQMLAQWSSQFPDQVSFSIDQQKSDVMLMASQTDAQDFCSPTPRLLHPEAFVMKYKKSVKDYLAYFYDTGGIALNPFDAGITEPYYNITNGVFLIIDPWSECGIMNTFGNNTSSIYQFASQNADAAVSRLCCKLERLHPESISAGFNIPICVVVTKCDINGLNNAIGADAPFTQSSKKWDEQSKRVEEFLVKHGMNNFVSIVKTQFKKNAFFAVSVLENSKSVLNPLLWMTYNA